MAPSDKTLPAAGRDSAVGTQPTVIRKVCLVGSFAVGKTSTAARFLSDTFSDKYLTTVGVKIGSRNVSLDATRSVRLVVWDIAGVDESNSLRASYLQGASGVIYVADGTRRSTLGIATQLRELIQSQLGEVPAVLLVNKFDLIDQWEVTVDDLRRAAEQGFDCHSTSASSGAGVREAFAKLAGKFML